MGLLEKAQKKKAEKKVVKPVKKPNLYFEPEKKLAQKKKPEQKIQKERVESLQSFKVRFVKPTAPKVAGTVGVSLDTGKIEVHRAPEDRAKELEKQTIEKPQPAEIDMSALKKAVETKLKRGVVAPPPVKPAATVAPLSTVGEKRVHTGISGLDDVMEGGFKFGSVNMIGGGAGSGKSIFGMQFLVDGIDSYNENGIYISFEESEEKILEDFKRFGWNLEEKIRNKRLIIMHYTPEQVEKVIEAGGGIVRDAIESINAKRLVIDSLTAFTLLHENELEKRKAVLSLFDAIHKWNVTALLTSEQEPDPEKHVSTIMEFETDGVILLYNVRKGDIRERSLEIFKMRGVHHAAKIFPMKIDDNGITIYPEEAVF